MTHYKGKTKLPVDAQSDLSGTLTSGIQDNRLLAQSAVIPVASSSDTKLTEGNHPAPEESKESITSRLLKGAHTMSSSQR